ncbi:hypothetical protein AMAG_19875 [Allomyces macrogynus ATCC 38327]|uniref:Uncharacterized protein n=1 Tax=Allomyces macrogynus (strain ATCC 38327) TaxID=578462 RepID=A0A0L0T2U1_ALLM3|nr:hypothetical protein AMAG_19875 [Allomyces macrogynus ATCC 38327]|eukprot:KNE69178.1 hypothetical protein AMAG_19875 [Allomyces macrogynus ATCC 38327]
MARTCSVTQLLQIVHDGAIDRAVEILKQALPDGDTATAVRMGLTKLEAMPSIAPDRALWLAALELLAVAMKDPLDALLATVPVDARKRNADVYARLTMVGSVDEKVVDGAVVHRTRVCAGDVFD